MLRRSGMLLQLVRALSDVFKDPREYLPFLRELRSLDKYYQRFRIDDHLKRHDNALRNLSLAGRIFTACEDRPTHLLQAQAISLRL
jgi:elongator complex protein 1